MEGHYSRLLLELTMDKCLLEYLGFLKDKVVKLESKEYSQVHLQ